MKASGAAAPRARPGALVISLDFELAWGVRDVFDADGPYRAHLLGAREAVPRLLDAFVGEGVAATWATVGILFADGRDEALAFAPEVRPAYHDRRLDPYPALRGRDPREPVGEGEADDPLHFAGSLVRQIAEAPGQELASHTYSHLTAMEAGVTAEAFEADLAAARAIAGARGWTLRSLVMPRHQQRPDLLPLVAGAGFVAHRGPEPHRLATPHAGVHDAPWRRLGRLADAVLPLTGANDAPWPRPDRHGLVDVPESRFLRPLLPRLGRWQERRIVGAMTAAARAGTICHLWWHPHNFGGDLEAHLAYLGRVLAAYRRLRDAYGFRSVSMGQVADEAARDAGAEASASGPSNPA